MPGSSAGAAGASGGGSGGAKAGSGGSTAAAGTGGSGGGDAGAGGQGAGGQGAGGSGVGGQGVGGTGVGGQGSGGTDAGGQSSGGAGAGGQSAGGATLFDCTPTKAPGTYVAEVVYPGGPAQLRSFLEVDTPPLDGMVNAFYQQHPADYDYIFLLTEDTSENAAFGRYYPVRSPSIPAIGLPSLAAEPGYAALTKLRGVVVLQLAEGQSNGPTLHEMLHAFGNFLHPSLGFGKDAQNDFGAHWGPAGVYGQLGGFDPATLVCLAPSAQDTAGCTQARTGPFGPNANGGDTVPYAPLELYLLGFLPPEEVPPIPMLVNATFQNQDPGTENLFFAVQGIKTVTIEQIVQTMGGARPPAPASERSLRAGFALVTNGAPVSPTAMQRAASWARVLGGVDPNPGLLSYCKATGGRATMRTDLP